MKHTWFSYNVNNFSPKERKILNNIIMNSILLIRPEWLNKIKNGEKTIEIRGQPCKSKINKTIGLAYCGPTIDKTKRKIILTAKLSGYKQYNNIDEYNSDINNHCSYHETLPYKKTYGWILEDVCVLKEEIEFEYKKGAVIWVNFV